MIHLKSEEDLKQMRLAGVILARIMRQLRQSIEPGMTTGEIDKIAAELAQKEKVIAAFKDYKGYPASICASVNDEIVHGIPGIRSLEEGDILSLDFGINYQGYFSDTAFTVGIGKINPKCKKLIEVTKQSLAEGIKKARVGNRLSDISHAVQDHVEKHGFSVVRQFVGHGIGRNLHEDPEIPNFGMAGRGPLLKHGMVLAIEPMVNMGSWESEIIENDWTAVTKDGLPSAHFEHTIAVTDNGPEILTAE